MDILKAVGFYFGKILQATGFVVLTLFFITKFPEIMNPKILGISLALFFGGRLLEKKLARK